jgi:hypothetical protein
MILCCLVRRIMDCLRIGIEKILELLEIGIGQITSRVQSTCDLDGKVEAVIERPRGGVTRSWDLCGDIIDSCLQSIVIRLIVGC